MNRKIATLFGMLLSFSMLMTSCKKDHNHDEEGELITTVKLNFEGGGETKTVTWKDADGDGGNQPVIESISLKPNTTYNVSVEFLDESKNPVEDITEEIKEEDDDHEVFYVKSSGLGLTITRLDKDSAGRDLGLLSTWVTTSNGTGSVQVVLKHKPGEKQLGDDVSKGETDIEVNFPISIN